MSRLPSQPGAWVNRYVGLPFVELGRGRDGVDCYGLLQLVYRDRLGVELEEVPADFEGSGDIGVIHAMHEALTVTSGTWRRVDEARLLDVAWLRIGGHERHVGIVVGRDKILHAFRGTDSCVEDLSSATWARRLVGIYRYAGPVRLVGRPRPFSDQAVDLALPAGGTIAELLTAAGVAVTPLLRVFVSGVEVLRDAWAHVRPKPGRLVAVAAVPDGGGEGGGKTALRLVATIAVIAGSVWAGGLAAGALGYAAGTTGFAVSSAVVTAGVAIAGTLAISALIPPPKPRLSESSLQDARSSPTIQGAGNSRRPYDPFTLVLGRHRVTPMLAAVPFSEIAGDDQYLRMLFGPLYGRLDISDIRIGDTSIHEYEGVELEVRNGYPGPELPITLYPDTVIENGLSILLEQTASWEVRTSATAADEISVEVTFPQGLIEFAPDGSSSTRTVAIEVEYSAAGAGAWAKINFFSPGNSTFMDTLFRTPECELGGSGVHAGAIAWGAGMPSAKPGYLPANGYSWVAEGWVYAPVTGEYRFGIDGQDAVDLVVAGRAVVGWYESHPAAGTPDFTGHNGVVTLDRGWHNLRIRMETRTGGGAGAVALGWRKPGDAAYSVIPAGNLAQDSAGAAAGLAYRWYDHSGYGSTITTTAARTEQIRRTLSWPTAPGQYDVRIRRVTADTSSTSILDKIYWTALRTIRKRDPITNPEGLVRIGVRIKASDQLQGVVDDLNFLAWSVVPDWNRDASAWVTRGTSNCSSLGRALLQGYGTKVNEPDAKFDLPAWEDFHEWCDDNGYEFNGVVDFRSTVFEVLSDVLSAGRASYCKRDGKHSVIIDRPQASVSQNFSPRNSWGFTGRKIMPKLPHAVRVGFLNEQLGYQRDERVVLADGYQLAGLDAFGQPAPGDPEPTEYGTLELFGTTHPDQAFKHGRFYLANMILRQEVYELSCDLEHLACRRGDKVMLTSDVAMLGLSSGRVTRVNLDGDGMIESIDVDNACPMAVGNVYRVRIRLGDTGGQLVLDVVTVDGYNTTLTLQTPMAPNAVQVRAGDLYQFGEPDLEARPCLVKSITVNDDLSAKLQLIDYVEGIYQADVGEIPPFSSGITRDPAFSDGPDAPVIEEIRSDDYVMVRDADGSLRPRMVITIRRPSGAKPIPTAAQVRTRPKPPGGGDAVGPWTHHPLTPIDNRQIPVDGVEEGVTYEIRLRVITAAGKASVWVDAEHTVVGKVNPPPDVQSFTAVRLSDGTRRFIWQLGPIPPDVAGVLIRYGDPGDAWADLSPLTSDSIEGASPWETALPPVSGVRRYAIKMVDTAGNESVNMTWFERDLGAPPMEGVAVSSDARFEGWPGTKTDCFVQRTGELEATDSIQWSTPPAATWAAWPRWNINPASPIVYTHTVIDVGFVADFEPGAFVDADGSYLVEVAYDEVSSSPTNWTAVADLAGTTVRGRYFRFRITVTATVGDPVPTVWQLVLQLRAQTVTEVIDNFNTFGLTVGRRFGPGDVRLPISPGRFQVIRSVALAFNGSGAGWTYEIVDKDPVIGPRVRIFNPSLAAADAVIDAVVRGL